MEGLRVYTDLPMAVNQQKCVKLDFFPRPAKYYEFLGSTGMSDFVQTKREGTVYAKLGEGGEQSQFWDATSTHLFSIW